MRRLRSPWPPAALARWEARHPVLTSLVGGSLWAGVALHVAGVIG